MDAHPDSESHSPSAISSSDYLLRPGKSNDPRTNLVGSTQHDTGGAHRGNPFRPPFEAYGRGNHRLGLALRLFGETYLDGDLLIQTARQVNPLFMQNFNEAFDAIAECTAMRMELRNSLMNIKATVSIVKKMVQLTRIFLGQSMKYHAVTKEVLRTVKYVSDEQGRANCADPLSFTPTQMEETIQLTFEHDAYLLRVEQAILREVKLVREVWNGVRSLQSLDDERYRDPYGIRRPPTISLSSSTWGDSSAAPDSLSSSDTFYTCAMPPAPAEVQKPAPPTLTQSPRSLSSRTTPQPLPSIQESTSWDNREPKPQVVVPPKNAHPRQSNPVSHRSDMTVNTPHRRLRWEEPPQQHRSEVATFDNQNTMSLLDCSSAIDDVSRTMSTVSSSSFSTVSTFPSLSSDSSGTCEQTDYLPHPGGSHPRNQPTYERDTHREHSSRGPLPGRVSGQSSSRSNQPVSQQRDDGRPAQRRPRFEDDHGASYRQDPQTVTVEWYGPAAPTSYRDTVTELPMGRSARPPPPQPSMPSVHHPFSSSTQTTSTQQSQLVQTSRPTVSQSAQGRHVDTYMRQQPMSSPSSQGPVYAQERPQYRDQDNSYPVAGPSRIQATAHDAQRRQGGIWPDIYGQSCQSQTTSRHRSNTSRSKAPDDAGRAYGS